MSENKKKTKETVAKANDKNVTKESKEKKGISVDKIPFIVTAGLLVVILVGMGIFAIANAIINDVGFDYLKSDLSKYIEFTDDYKDFTVNVDIAKPTETDVKTSILNMLYADRVISPIYGNEPVDQIIITPGDQVYIWYRGYLEGDEKKSVTGLSNFNLEEAEGFGIGSKYAPSGFELGLVGINTEDCTKFEKITSGVVNESQIAYITYTKTKGNDSNTKVTEENVRIDFSADIDATFGAGFKEKIIGLEIGKKTNVSATLDSTVYNYTDLTVNFVTECEKDPLLIKARFSHNDNRSNLRNKNVIFEVYIEKVVVYDTPEFNDEYIKKKIEDKTLDVTVDELEKFGKDNLAANCYAYLEKLANENYEEEKKSLTAEAIWSYLNKITKSKKYPKIKVEEIYEDYVDDIVDQYVSTDGYLVDSSGQYKKYNFDQYAALYLGLSANADWESEVYRQSENFVKERIILFYILKEENLLPSDEKFKAEYDKIVQDYIDIAVETYFKNNEDDKDRDEYSEEELADIIEECREVVFSIYDENHFTIRAYYNILIETIIEWPEVITLDDSRSQPQDK